MTDQMEQLTTTERPGERVADPRLDQRVTLRLRHAHALTSLMAERDDLRGVHALADHFDDAVRWPA